MSNYSKEIWVLITRELSGEATPAEKTRLRQWLNDDPTHRGIFENLRVSWEEHPSPSVNTPFFFDYERGLKKLKTKINQEKHKPQIKEFPRQRNMQMFTWAVALSVIVVAFLLSLFVSMYIFEESESVTAYETTGAEQRIITLSDGSVVRLNRDSKIEVDKSYNENGNRTIRLTGEAFFDIAEHPDRPFMVEVKNAVIQVLGTAFNVKSAEEVMVAVQQGLVSLRYRDHEEKSAASLVAGQLGLLSPGGHEVVIEETNIENYMSWKNGYLRFESMPFSEVATQLERIYGFEQKVQDEAIASYRLTAYTERIKPEEVLNNIALALDLTYVHENDRIIWQKK